MKKELIKHPWETMVPKENVEEQDLFDCPLLCKVSEGRSTKVDWITCYHDMNTSRWPISRGMCKEVYSVCMNCRKDPMISENLVLPARFEFATLEEAQEEWFKMLTR